MDTDTSHPRTVSRRLLASVVLGCCTVLTLLTGLVVGWFATSFFFFGARPTAEDYEVAAGAYGAAAFALLLGAVALSVHGTTRWQVPTALVGAALLTWLAVSAGVDAATHDDPGIAVNHWWDGAGGVIACPWTWPLVVLGLLAPFRRARDVDVSG